MENSFLQNNLVIEKFLDKNRKVLKEKSLSPQNSKMIYDEYKLNYAKVYVPENADKISVVGNYRINDEGFRYCNQFARLEYDEQTDTLFTSLHNGQDWDDFYYGVSPIIDASLIVEEIRKKMFQGENGVRRFVCKYAKNFMCHEKGASSLSSIAQYIIVGMLLKFGVKILCTPSVEERIKGLPDDDLTIVKKVRDDKRGVYYLFVHGCPSEDFFKVLKGISFAFDGDVLSEAKEGEAFEILFEKKGVVHNLNGGVYYSGVLLRTLQIEKEVDAVNRGIVALKFHFERTTYATVDALSNNFTNVKCLDKDAREEIIKILRNDDELKQTLLKERDNSSSEKFLTNVNEYLSKTISAVQVGVSANVVSSNGFLLFGTREKDAIDANSMYPGVNGNAEIADKNVNFYKTSTHEDYPEIDVNNLLRLDFNGEISREMIAELNVETFSKNWDCYGICLSGTTPSFFESGQKGNYEEKERRLHFNILFEQQIGQELYEIKQSQKIATEKYENKSITGIRYSFYKNTFSFIRHKLASFLKNLLNCKDVITTLLAIFLFFISLNEVKQTFSAWVSMVFSILVLIQSSLNIVADFPKIIVWLFSKKRTVLSPRIDIMKILDKEFLGKQMHPVVPILLLCYLNKHK